MFGWGWNNYRQLGADEDTDFSFPQRVWPPLAVCAAQTRGEGPETEGARWIACGGWHSVLQTETSGTVLGIGWNVDGQLGPFASLSSNSDGPAAGDKDNDDDDLACGFRVMFRPSASLAATRFDCGRRHTALQLSDGRVVSCGSDALGQTADVADSALLCCGGWATLTVPLAPAETAEGDTKQ